MEETSDDQRIHQIEQELRRMIAELQLIPDDMIPEFTLKIEYFQEQEGLEHSWGYSKRKNHVWVALWGPDLKAASRYLIAQWYREYQKKRDPSFFRTYRLELSLLLFTGIIFFSYFMFFYLKFQNDLLSLAVIILPTIQLLDLYMKSGRFIDLSLKRQRQLLILNKERHDFNDEDIEEYVKSFRAFEKIYRLIILVFLIPFLLFSVVGISSYFG